jgi:hypothetical protein
MIGGGIQKLIGRGYIQQGDVIGLIFFQNKESRRKHVKIT